VTAVGIKRFKLDRARGPDLCIARCAHRAAAIQLDGFGSSFLAATEFKGVGVELGCPPADDPTPFRSSHALRAVMASVVS
jgi:hypothetical protein